MCDLIISTSLHGYGIKIKSFPTALFISGAVAIYLHAAALWQYGLRFICEKYDPGNGWLGSDKKLLFPEPKLRLGSRYNLQHESNNLFRVGNNRWVALNGFGL